MTTGNRISLSHNPPTPQQTTAKTNTSQPVLHAVQDAGGSGI